MKKKKSFRQLGRLLLISQSWSRYNILYREIVEVPGHDTAEQALGCAAGRCDTALPYGQKAPRHG